MTQVHAIVKTVDSTGGEGSYRRGDIVQVFPPEPPTSELVGALSENGTTIVVGDTSAFPSSGTLSIWPEQITYTGKTGSEFLGVTRNAGGLPAGQHLQHAAGKKVREHKDYSAPYMRSGVDAYGTKSLYRMAVMVLDLPDATIAALQVEEKVDGGGNPGKSRIEFWNQPEVTATRRAKLDDPLQQTQIPDPAKTTPMRPVAVKAKRVLAGGPRPIPAPELGR